MGIWHAGNIISNVFSGLLAAAILTNMDNIAGLHAWQWFVLIEGRCSRSMLRLRSNADTIDRHDKHHCRSLWFLPSSQLA